MKLWTILLLATLAWPASVRAQAIDVTGTWDVSVNTPDGARPATLAITRAADKLSGTITGPQGDVPAEIVLKDTDITISFTVQGQNGSINLVMTGMVQGNEMKGTLDMGGRGSAPWTAKRSSPPPAKTESQQDKPAATMTGTWAFEVHHSAGVSTPTVTITQTGEKLSGKYVGSYGESVLTGSIKGSDFTFSVEIGTEQKVTVVYTGTLSGDSVKGSLTMGEMGEGTFTGKRK